MVAKPFQDYYPDHLSYCYGCGKLNKQGYQIKTFWNGDETLTTFTPKTYHTAIPGFVYGGLLASLIDCHATGSAAGAMYKQQNREMDSEPAFRFLTGSLTVNYLKPTPINCILHIKGRILEINGRKVKVEVNVVANEIITVKGEVIAIQVPSSYIDEIIRNVG